MKNQILYSNDTISQICAAIEIAKKNNLKALEILQEKSYFFNGLASNPNIFIIDEELYKSEINQFSKMMLNL